MTRAEVFFISTEVSDVFDEESIGLRFETSQINELESVGDFAVHG